MYSKYKEVSFSFLCLKCLRLEKDEQKTFFPKFFSCTLKVTQKMNDKRSREANIAQVAQILRDFFMRAIFSTFKMCLCKDVLVYAFYSFFNFCFPEIIVM